MKTVTINSLPTSVDEFIKLRDQFAVTPEGGAAIFLLAFKLFSENKTLGEQCLIIAVDRDHLQEGNTYKGFQMMRGDISLMTSQLSKNSLIPNSYIKGSNPENNYAVKLPFVYNFSTNPYSGSEESGQLKLFVECSGADSARPLHVKRNNRGLWKTNNWSSVIVGIKKKQIDDDI